MAEITGNKTYSAEELLELGERTNKMEFAAPPKLNSSIKIPSGQKVCLTFRDKGREKYIITKNTIRQLYYLYEVGNDWKLKKVATKQSPVFKQLEEDE